MHLIYIHLLTLPLLQVFVLLCNLAEMEVRYIWQLWTSWRQHRGDSALFVCESLPAYRSAPLLFFCFYWQGRQIGTKEDYVLCMKTLTVCHCVPPCTICVSFTTFWTSFWRWTSCFQHMMERYASITGAIMTPVWNYTKDINQPLVTLRKKSQKGKANLSTSSVFHAGGSSDGSFGARALNADHVPLLLLGSCQGQISLIVLVFQDGADSICPHFINIFLPGVLKGERKGPCGVILDSGGLLTKQCQHAKMGFLERSPDSCF